MSDEKGDVMFSPGPPREGGSRQVGREKNQPEIEPGRAVNVGARNFRVEAGFQIVPAIAPMIRTASRTTA